MVQEPQRGEHGKATRAYEEATQLAAQTPRRPRSSDNGRQAGMLCGHTQAHSHARGLAVFRWRKVPIQNARDVYTRRQEGVSIWVVESKHITASNPEKNGEMFEPAADKVYRHPTFYELPDDVKHM